MATKTYKTHIDLRILGDKIKFLFFISNVASNTTTKSYNKKKCFTFTYDTNEMVEVICLTTDGVDRMFLKFAAANLYMEKNLNIFSTRKSDMVIEVFKNNKGVFGFENVIGSGFGAFLSHPKYFATTIPKKNSRGVGALLPFDGVVMGKNHSLQMLFAGANITQDLSRGISFDMDIHIESEGQYIQSLGFKLNKEDITIIYGTTLDVKSPKQIINYTPNISLTTTYISLNSNDLASSEILYDYKKALKSQNVDACSLTLMESNVYVIKNPTNLNTNLEDLKLTKQNIIEIPYNISREVESGKIKPTKKILKNGKELYPLGWINELRDNKIVSSADKCLSLKFNNKEQIKAFTEKLKKQQIGNIESYPILNTSAKKETQITRVKKTYSKISQWIERSTLDEYNDAKFTYDSEGYIRNILICPRKKTQVNNQSKGTQCGLYSDGTQYTKLDGQRYTGDFHIDPKLGPLTGKDSETTQKELLIELYNYVPIGTNSDTDFYLSTVGKKDTTIYSSFTSTTQSIDEPNNTYDIHISASSFSAHSATTGTTCIPISNINRETILPMIGDVNKQFKPYTFSGVYSGNKGNALTLDETDPKHYMTYTVQSSGVYRFTYKAHLNIKYKDTKWCEYVDRICPSSVSATTGIYPQNDYQTKRLINTSIIQAGQDETNTILQDTGFQGHPGYRYKSHDGVDIVNTPTNSGLLNFEFSASLLKYVTGTTGTTSATPVTLITKKVLRSKIDGDADNYLTLNVSENDKYSNDYNVCIASGVSATTIFHKQIPITLDTGLITLKAGDIIELAYDTNWLSTSKGTFFGGGGITNLDINLGHELDILGKSISSPWYRGVKLSTNVIQKNLFFDPSKQSKDFKMNTDGTDQKIKLDGTLYLSDQQCGNILVPTITPQTFMKNTFLDSSAPNHKLVWDVTSTKPRNNWQNLIENNKIKDYQLTKSPNNKLTVMKKDGVFCFYLPTYNSDYGAKCNFNFPQLTQSYVVVNKFKNFFGGDITHYIVVTPSCNFYKPCSGTKVLTDYDILHKTRPDKWKVENVGKKITINGKEIRIISDGSYSHPKPTTLPNQTICKYFCDCGQNIAETLEIDPIYGITDVFTDLGGRDCTDCIKTSREHCGKINRGCKPVIIEDCSELQDYTESTTEDGIVIKLKGKVISSPDTNPSGGGTDGPASSRYSCMDGVCQENSNGLYSTLDLCIEGCTPIPSGDGPPRDPDVSEDRGGGDESNICKKGEYWCETRGCIPLDETC
tara:strand:- start:2411 stop:6157 length:3747 start_codon:yes stop_codon:yes gene_type:complete